MTSATTHTYIDSENQLIRKRNQKGSKLKMFVYIGNQYFLMTAANCWKLLPAFNTSVLNPGLCSVEIEAEDYILSSCLERGLRSRWVRSYASVKNAFMLQYTSQFHSHSRSCRQLVWSITEAKIKQEKKKKLRPSKHGHLDS